MKNFLWLTESSMEIDVLVNMDVVRSIGPAPESDGSILVPVDPRFQELVVKQSMLSIYEMMQE